MRLLRQLDSNCIEDGLHVNWQVAIWGYGWLSQAKNLNAFGQPWLYMSNYVNTCLNLLSTSFFQTWGFFFTFPAKDSFHRKSNMCFRSSASAFEFCLTRTTQEVSCRLESFSQGASNVTTLIRLVKFEEMRGCLSCQVPCTSMKIEEC